MTTENNGDEHREIVDIRSEVRASNIDYIEGGLALTGREVVILGAGFSRAIADAFPLTDQLGNAVAERAGLLQSALPPGGFHDGNFETWLSQLADPPPYCMEEEIFQRRALLAQVTRSLDVVLRDREYIAFSEEAPEWLLDFVGLAHYRRMTLVTFNYDTSIETAVESHAIWRRDRSLRTIAGDDILENLPPRYMGGVPQGGAPSTTGGALPIAPTLQLLKLHGSLDWFWSPGDATGATLRRVGALGQFAAPVLDDPESRDREAPGLVPFIVPPTATKSLYFQNPLTRRLWRTAFEALRHAPRVALVGYSLPAADLVAAAMLSDALRDRSPTIDVVNPRPDEVCERLQSLGIADPSVTSGHDCVEQFVAAMRKRIALDAAEQVRVIRRELDDALVIFRWGSADSRGKAQHDAFIERVERTNDDLRLVVMTGAADPSRATSVSTLRSHLDVGVSLSVVVPGGTTLPIVGLKPLAGASGGGQRNFLELYTCRRTPL